MINLDKIKYKSLLKKRMKREDDQAEMKIEEDLEDDNFKELWVEENTVRKIDYDSLDLILYKKQMTDYHALIDYVNLWAISLGFLLKLKRSPKINADGSQTLRLYCSSYKKSDPLPGKNRNDSPNCKFALTFKQEEKTGCWLLYQEYSREKMTHCHALEKRKYDSIR